jgi:hypothetical protein
MTNLGKVRPLTSLVSLFDTTHFREVFLDADWAVLASVKPITIYENSSMIYIQSDFIYMPVSVSGSWMCLTGAEK